MINEFALDPVVLSTWEMVRFFLDKFGIDQGRFIAQYPNYRFWCDIVLNQFPAQISGQMDLARKHVVEKLQQTKWHFAASRTSPLRPSLPWLAKLSWLANAEQEHINRQFHAIVTRENPHKRPHIIVADEISEHDPPPLWRVERCKEVKRKGVDMANAVAPLFRLAKTVLFVDRNFRPSDAHYRVALAALLRTLWNCCPNRKDLRVEYHTGDKFDPAEFERNDTLAASIPRGLRLSVVRWRYKELHDRYIITDFRRDGHASDCVAVQFGQGL